MKLLTCKIVDFYPWKSTLANCFMIYRSINFIAKIWKTQIAPHLHFNIWLCHTFTDISSEKIQWRLILTWNYPILLWILSFQSWTMEIWNCFTLVLDHDDSLYKSLLFTTHIQRFLCWKDEKFYQFSALQFFFCYNKIN